MHRTDTAKIYKEFIDAGFNEKHAMLEARAIFETEEKIETSVLQWMKELKDEFVSHKMFTGMMGLVVVVLMFTLYKVFDLSSDMSYVKTTLVYLQNEIRDLKPKS